MSDSKKKLTTVPMRVPIWMDPIVSSFAAKRGISKSEAMGRMFQTMYPNADVGAEPFKPPGAGDFLVEDKTRIPVAGAAPATPLVSDTLRRSVEDLTNIRAINALSMGLNGDRGRGGEKLTTREILEFRTLGALPMPAGGGYGRGQQQDPAIAQLTTLVGGLQQQMQGLAQNMGDNLLAAANKRIDEYENRDRRAAEFQPLYEQINSVNNTLSTLAEKVANMNVRGDAPPPAVRSEILKLGEDIKEAMETLAGNMSRSGIGLTEVDTLIETANKLKDTFLPAAEKGEGEISPTTMAISTTGEVAKELVKEYGLIRREQVGLDGAPGSKIPTRQEIIERQVLHFVTRAIESGAMEINAQEAAAELGCEPEEVLRATDNLQKKGLITVGGKGKQQRKELPPGPGQTRNQPRKLTAEQEKWVDDR